MNQDQEHLRLLSIFHYVLAGIAALSTCFWALVFLIGIAQTIDPEFLGPRNRDPEEVSDLAVTIMSAGLALMSAAFATCLIISGRGLSQRKRYTFCVVLAGFACMLFPFGTALGIFTLVVLTRASVKTLFDGAVPPVYAS